MVDRFAAIRGADGGDEMLEEPPFLVGHQIPRQDHLRRSGDLESRRRLAVNPFCQHGLVSAPPGHRAASRSLQVSTRAQDAPSAAARLPALAGFASRHSPLPCLFQVAPENALVAASTDCAPRMAGPTSPVSQPWACRARGHSAVAAPAGRSGQRRGTAADPAHPGRRGSQARPMSQDWQERDSQAARRGRCHGPGARTAQDAAGGPAR